MGKVSDITGPGILKCPRCSFSGRYHSYELCFLTGWCGRLNCLRWGSSFPKTGILQGGRSGSSKRISFTLDKSTNFTTAQFKNNGNISMLWHHSIWILQLYFQMCFVAFCLEIDILIVLWKPCNSSSFAKIMKTVFTFDASVDSGQSADDGVFAVSLSDVNPGGEQSVGWLRVHQWD